MIRAAFLAFAVLAATASAPSPLTTVRLVSRPASLTAGTPWTATIAIRRAGKPSPARGRVTTIAAR